jgi:dihydroorotate dehydrogenase (NAD+) catalytic subunit
MGGVQCGRDAAELISAGATLVAVGTENFRDPAAASRVSSELKALQNARKRSTSLNSHGPQVEV